MSDALEPHVESAVARCPETLKWRDCFPVVPCDLPIHPGSLVHGAWQPGATDYSVRLSWQTIVMLDEPHPYDGDDCVGPHV